MLLANLTRSRKGARGRPANPDSPRLSATSSSPTTTFFSLFYPLQQPIERQNQCVDPTSHWARRIIPFSWSERILCRGWSRMPIPDSGGLSHGSMPDTDNFRAISVSVCSRQRTNASSTWLASIEAEPRRRQGFSRVQVTNPFSEYGQLG